MPYIDKETRQRMDREGFLEGDKSGVLTYQLWKVLEDWMKTGRGGRWSYGTMSEVVGCLESAKLEYCRRHLWPYEDEKIAENGDLPLDD
jgi:hypothetical protein